MKSVSDFMAAFKKIGERGDPSEANLIPGAPRIKLAGWPEQKRIKSSVPQTWNASRIRFPKGVFAVAEWLPEE